MPSDLRRRWPLVLTGLAAGSSVLAYLWAAQHVRGYRHSAQPVTWAGAWGQPDAWFFNLFALIVPGLLMTAVAWMLRARLPAGSGWPARLGAQMALLACLAMLAQGLWPLDVEAMQGAATRRHATAWMVWPIATTIAAALLAIGTWRWPRWRALAGSSAWLAIIMPLAPAVLTMVIPGPLLQRLLWLAWWLWWLSIGWTLARVADPAATGRDAAAALR